MIDFKDRSFRTGAVITGFVLIVLLVGLFWTPYDPNAMNAAEKMLSPCLRHPFGTDNFGRDIFSRVVQGAGSTFLIALGSVGIGLLAGVIVGGLTGWYGGWVDEVLMRVNDSLTAFPSLLTALVLIAVFGSGRHNIILALGVLFIPTFARIVRMEVARQKALDYVRNAKLMGVKEPAHPLCAHPAQHPAGAAEHRRHQLQQRRAGRGLDELPRSRRTAARPESGPHAGRGAGLSAARALVRGLDRSCHRAARAGLRPSERGAGR